MTAISMHWMMHTLSSVILKIRCNALREQIKSFCYCLFLHISFNLLSLQFKLG